MDRSTVEPVLSELRHRLQEANDHLRHSEVRLHSKTCLRQTVLQTLSETKSVNKLSTLPTVQNKYKFYTIIRQLFFIPLLFRKLIILLLLNNCPYLFYVSPGESLKNALTGELSVKKCLLLQAC